MTIAHISNGESGLSSRTKINSVIDFVNNARIRLMVDATYYISTAGNDTTGDGTVGNPWRTFQHAVDTAALTLDFGGNTVNIQAANGTYAESVFVSSWVGGGTLLLLGDPVTPSNVVINSPTHCIFSVARNDLQVSGIKLIAGGGFAGALFATAQTSITVAGKIEFGTSSGVHFWSESGVFIINSDYLISGGATYHYLIEQSGASLSFNSGFTVTLTGTPAFGVFAFANNLGEIANSNGGTYSGSATGQRYLANMNSVIWTNTGNINFFPGNAPGNTTNGGQFG